MRRILLIGLLLAAAAGFVALSTGASEEKGTGEYKVELDNAFGLVEGGDFKVAGVSAGRITTLEVDKRTKRALVGFEVTEDGFGSLRTDASCEVMPQSLVGEYFVNCEPGKAREKLQPGDTIPVERTASTVPPDLVANIMRRPRRERLRLIVNELGAAVAGNADNLNAALRRASPALRETNRVLRILAEQNQVLADLARNADEVVGELSDNRREISRWVVEARDTARASAERDEDIRRGFQRLPTFLAELEPTMRELGLTVERQGPALQNLAASADQLERLLENIPPFAEATRPALRSLGEASVTGRQAVAPGRETVRQLSRYAEGVPELGRNLAIILEHLDDRDNAIEDDARSPGGQGYTGLEALLQYTFDQTLAVNLHDGNVHILQVFPFEGACAPYSDLSAVPELGEQCGRFLGPNPLGIKSADPTAPANWDRNDRGPEGEDPNNRRRTAPADRDLARDRGDDRGRSGGSGGGGSGGSAGGGGTGGGSGGGGDDGGGGGARPPVRLPDLDDILPGGGGGGGGGGAPQVPQTPQPPAVRDLPNLGTAAARDGGDSDRQLMEFLFGS
ncbi:MAG TPA: MlaD family protein [Solirubrobacteraceae bacterium]|nr:MlaD family protein [Solirubrobacteraceae bacterium]